MIRANFWLGHRWYYVPLGIGAMVLTAALSIHFATEARTSARSWPTAFRASPQPAKPEAPGEPTEFVASHNLDHPKQGQRAHADSDMGDEDEDHSWLSRSRSFPAGAAPISARLEAFRRSWEMQAPRDSAAAQPWTFIGPESESGVSNCGTDPCSGRVTAIAVDPTNPDIVYIGGAEGGVWKTTNGGTTWTPLTDFQASLSIGALAIGPSNPTTIYAGTGEQNDYGHEYPGVGILESTDGGTTWDLLASSVFGGQTIGALAVSPANPQLILAAAKLGVYQSLNGGTTWKRVLPTDVPADFVGFQPGNPNTAYASVGGRDASAYAGVYMSVDAGATWQAQNGSANPLPVGQAGRIAIAIAPSSPMTLYAGISSIDSTSLTLYQSTNGGVSWTSLGSPAYCPAYSTLETAQCDYNNVIAVSPVNPKLVLAGGIELLVSQDGGANWSSGQAVHVDQHAIAFSADGTRVYVGNDGGVFSSDLTGTSYSWNSLNSTLALAQFYSGISIGPANANLTFGGTQDNNVLQYTGGVQWKAVTGGDGAATAIDSNGNAYASLAGGSAKTTPVLKSTQGGAFVTASNGIDTNTKPMPPYLAMDPQTPANLYYTGLTQLYQSTDAANSWAPIPQDPSVSLTDLCTIAVAPSDSNTVYTGSCDGQVWVTHNALQAGNSSWSNITQGLPLRAVTHITVDPGSALKAYVTLSGSLAGHVYRTDDGGADWTDITGNLPDSSVNDLVLDPALANTLYAATDLGVYWTNTGGQVWTALGAGLPNSPATSMQLYEPTRILRVATYGRGVWDLSAPANSNLIPLVSSAALSNPTSLSVTGQNFISGSVVYWNGAALPTTMISSTQLTATLSASDTSVDELATVTVFSPGPGGGQSQPQYVKIGPAPAIYPSGIVNAASLAPGYGLAPGSLATVFGVNLGSATTQADTASQLPVVLGNTSLSILDSNITVPYSARLLYAGPTQINFQVPWEIRTADTANFHVISSGTSSASVVEDILPFAPGIFTVATGNAPQGAITNAAGELAAAAPLPGYPNAQAAKRGEFITIYCTGLGAVTNRPGDGSPAASDPLSVTIITPSVLIGDVPAPPVQFSGLTPGGIGLYQINVMIPASAPTGNSVPLMISDGNGNYSNTVFLAIQ